MSTLVAMSCHSPAPTSYKNLTLLYPLLCISLLLHQTSKRFERLYGYVILLVLKPPNSFTNYWIILRLLLNTDKMKNLRADSVIFKQHDYKIVNLYSV